MQTAIPQHPHHPRRARVRIITAPRATCLRNQADPTLRPGWRAALAVLALGALLVAAAAGWGG